MRPYAAGRAADAPPPRSDCKLRPKQLTALGGQGATRPADRAAITSRLDRQAFAGAAAQLAVQLNGAPNPGRGAGPLKGATVWKGMGGR